MNKKPTIFSLYDFVTNRVLSQLNSEMSVLETNLHRPFYGNDDFTQIMIESGRSGYVTFGPNYSGPGATVYITLKGLWFAKTFKVHLARQTPKTG